MCRKRVHRSREAGHSGVWVKVRAGHAQVGRNTGHLNKKMSWIRAAEVKLEWGLKAGCRSLPGLSAARRGPASNTSSGRVPTTDK